MGAQSSNSKELNFSDHKGNLNLFSSSQPGRICGRTTLEGSLSSLIAFGLSGCLGRFCGNWRSGWSRGPSAVQLPSLHRTSRANHQIVAEEMLLWTRCVTHQQKKYLDHAEAKALLAEARATFDISSQAPRLLPEKRTQAP